MCRVEVQARAFSSSLSEFRIEVTVDHIHIVCNTAHILTCRVCFATHCKGDREMRGEADYRDTDAARMLADGLRRAATEKGVSQRDLAKVLGYKQSVVLSHMALGRVPIPVDRAPQLAALLDLNQKTFILAVLGQRYPDVSWEDWSDATPARHVTHLERSIEKIAQRGLDELEPGQMKVMREVAADPNAERRWLSVHEVNAVNLLRPDLTSSGLSPQDENLIEGLLTS
jgi:hypothetical protein